MRKTGVYLLLTLTLIIAIGIAFQDFRLDNSSTREFATSAARGRDLAGVSALFSDLRAGQVAYLAAGQNPQFWTERVSVLATQIEGELTRLQDSARSSESAQHLDAARASFADLMATDARARRSVESDQMLVASDVVLADSLQIVQRFQEELGTARNAETATGNAVTARLSLLRLATTDGGILAILCLAMVAAFTGRTSQPAVTMAQMLRELPPPVKTTSTPSAPAASPLVVLSPISASTAAAASVMPAPVSEAAPALAASTINLPDAAELCGDLARVMDGRDIQALLQRAARLLDATGVIVWVVDAPGTTLQPLLTHGYPERVLRRLGTLDAAADNVTSLSFRSGKPQSMNASQVAGSGALAVPLVTASGCTGVLAAEIRQAKPSADSLALARIVAAQLATIIGPMDASAPKAANA